MTDNTPTPQACTGADDPEERCPRHPSECECWQVDLDHPTVKQATPQAGEKLVERYDVTTDCGMGVMEPHENGDYVLYSAILTLQSNIEKLEELADSNWRRAMIAESEVVKLRAALEKAEAEIDDIYRSKAYD